MPSPYRARSSRFVVGVGVAKSGAAYVPIDPNYPADRVAHMVSDSGVVLGLTTTELVTLSPIPSNG